LRGYERRAVEVLRGEDYLKIGTIGVCWYVIASRLPRTLPVQIDEVKLGVAAKSWPWTAHAMR
jgi:hypothetical protein